MSSHSSSKASASSPSFSATYQAERQESSPWASSHSTVPKPSALVPSHRAALSFPFDPTYKNPQSAYPLISFLLKGIHISPSSSMSGCPGLITSSSLPLGIGYVTADPGSAAGIFLYGVLGGSAWTRGAPPPAIRAGELLNALSMRDLYSAARLYM